MAILSICAFASLLAVSSAASCDGQDFKCNHTDTRLNITDVSVESATKIHWKAEDTLYIKMEGFVNDYNIIAGTLHYKIWEFGVAHFRTSGSLDYFVCGPPPKPCNKAEGKALHLAHPTNLSSGFVMHVSLQLPKTMASGIMTIDLWGEDQDHEPYDFTSSILLHYSKAIAEPKPTVTSKCDGKDFACNHTDTKLAITHVDVESASGIHWKAKDTVSIKMLGHLKGFDITAGTLHYKIWEFGVTHFRTSGALDYFVCGPPPKPCNKAEGKALHLTTPSSLNSGFTMKIGLELPVAMSSGIMTIDLWGEDQNHEPYDFTSSILLHYSKVFANLKPAAPVKCDGKDFECNHTDTRLTIKHVAVHSASGIHWKAEDTISVSMTGHLRGINITAGTLHYKVWEFGVQHFRTSGGLDYFVCGPPPAPCHQNKGKALHLTTPTSLESAFTMHISLKLPKELKTGIMTVDLWGEDQHHEPYDFMSSILLHYTK